MRASTGNTLKQRSMLTLEDFKGVDLTSSPHRVPSNRAVDMVNLIYENGANRKRRGWRQRMSMERLENGGVENRQTAIDGLFHYRYGEEDTVLIVSGNQIYGYDPRDGSCGALLWYDRYDEYAHPAGRCQFFMNGGKCYILSEKGDIFVYGAFEYGFEVKPLAELYYIPTTTVSIEPDSVTDMNVEVLEKPNVLTPRRKNGLRTGSDPNGMFMWQYYTLDTPIEPFSEVKVTYYHDRTSIGGVVEQGTLLNKVYPNVTDPYNIKGYFEGETGASETVDNYLIDEEDQVIKGAIRWGSYDGTTQISATIVLYDFNPPDEFDNVTVEFQVVSSVWEYDPNMINGCRFGALFGTDGNTDRLFLSGNPDYPNQVFYSGFDELSYFPDDGCLVAGGDSAPISGFARVSDRSLAVFKSRQDGDDTVFYITGTQHPTYDAEGNVTGGKAIFTVSGGGMGEGCVSPYATANLSGEAVFLGADSVFSVYPSENATTGVRNVREKGLPIARRLREKLREHAGDAAAVVFEGRYYLCVGDVCFVADSRHQYAPAADAGDGAYQYEWWYWENVPARVWAVMDGVLWFGTSDGRVCSFDGEGYSDETFFEFGEGELTADGDAVIYPYTRRGQLQEGDLLAIPDAGGGMRRWIISELHERVTDGGVSCPAFRLKRYADGEPLERVADVLPELTALRWYHRRTVSARWVSPYFHFGSDMHEKTLLGLTVTAGEGSGRFQFGYEAKRSSARTDMRGMDTLNFDAVSFSRFSFDNAFASSYTVRMNARSINYVRFCFFSDTPEEMTVERLTALYKINRTNRGVR